MNKSSKVIIAICLLLIITRIFNPVKTITTPTGVTVEYDPIFDELSSNKSMREVQIYAKTVGKTSITNLYHSIYLIIISFGLVLLIRKFPDN